MALPSMAVRSSLIASWFSYHGFGERVPRTCCTIAQKHDRHVVRG